MGWWKELVVEENSRGCHVVVSHRPHQRGSGYPVITRAGRSMKANRYVWELWEGPIPHGMFVMHKCDNPMCVNIEHLMLGTPGDNARDASAKGRLAWGEDKTNAKLTESQVREIRRSYKTQRALASDYGVAPVTIWNIRQKRKWRHA